MKLKDTIKSLNPFSQIKELKKQVKIAMGGILQAQNPDYRNQMLYPSFPYSMNALDQLAINSDVISSIHFALKREIFRNGYDLQEAINTDEETTTSEEEVNIAGNPQQRKEILEFLEECNNNGQTITGVCEELEDDLNTWDDAYMAFIKTYYIDAKGNVATWDLDEIKRFDPRIMQLVINRYDEPGKEDDGRPINVCPLHRDRTTENSICNDCGSKTFPAFFKTIGEVENYYYKNEIVHRSKYRPSKRKGTSPLIAVWQKTRTLLCQDTYIMELYDGQRPPKAGLFFNTSNQAGLTKTWDSAKQQANENPHLPIVMGIQNSTQSREFVQFIDFMKSLNEMQYTEARKDMIRQIGGVFGVEPIFQADTSSSGGLNNEGLQITVTNRAVEYGQKQYNNYFFPKIMDAMLLSGWSLELQPSEEQDEMAKLERQSKSLDNGEAALKLGLTATYDSDVGECIIESGDLEKPKDPFSGLPNFGEGNSAPDESTPNEENSGAPSNPETTKGRKSFSNLSNKIKEEVEKFINTFKGKPTEAEISKAISKINLNLKAELDNSTKGLFESIYRSEVGKVEKEIGKNISFSHIDSSSLFVLSNQDVLSKAYYGLTDEITKNLNKIITQAYRNPKGLSLKQITNKIQDLVNISDFKAERIARTETSKVSSAARKNSYQKEEGFETFLFKHIGPNDNRTTSTSKRIKERTKAGVTFEEYIKILEEESVKDFPTWTVDKNAPVSHWNSRHSYVRTGSLTQKIKTETAEKKKKIIEEAAEKELILKKKAMDDNLELLKNNQEIQLLRKKQKLIEELENAK